MDGGGLNIVLLRNSFMFSKWKFVFDGNIFQFNIYCLVWVSFLLLLQVLKSGNNLKNPDVEIQQRSMEYLQLSTVATADVLVRTINNDLHPLNRVNNINWVKTSSLIQRL